MNQREISIPSLLEVGPSHLEKTGHYLRKSGFRQPVIFYGEGIKTLFSERLKEAFKENPSFSISAVYECAENTMEAVMSYAYTLPSHSDCIVGIGGGKVLDVAKYVAFLNNLPFISVPTSPAHDGFASSGCSLYIKGRRTSVGAKNPFGIIVDTDIIKDSPEKFLFSGIGDIVSKITAVFDWQYEEREGVARTNGMAVMIAKKSVNSIVRMPFQHIKEEFFIKELIDSLTMSGLAMEIAGSSAPASGSEHLISHALDKGTDTPQLHGIQVGIATYLMSLVQEHRVARIRKFLSDTGFFDYVKTLNLDRKDYERAVELAPLIKPERKLYIHIPENREKAKRLLSEDTILKNLFV